MSSFFETDRARDFSQPALLERRKRLLARQKGRPFLIPSGFSRPRNYAANTYPFRASSHFLWSVGWSIEGAYLASDGRQCILFIPEETASDQIWHGQGPALAEWGAFLGIEVLSYDRLSDWLSQTGKERFGTLAPPDARGLAALEKLLERSLQVGTERDLVLARSMVELRLCQDGYAVASMRQASQVTALAFDAGKKICRSGTPERVVSGAMMGQIFQAGMAPAYQPIVTTQGQVLHQPFSDGTCKNGDLLLADVGAESWGGLASDVTRTWPVSGEWSATQRNIYEAVLTAQQSAIALVRPGARYRDIHLAACRSLIQSLISLRILRGDLQELLHDGIHALFFPHGIGHLLGYDVHDMEDLGDLAGYDDGRMRSTQFGLSYLRMDRDLRPGMIVTIEPGFYQIPVLLNSESELSKKAGDRLNRSELLKYADVRGIRIEDDILVTESGFENLTAAIPKI